MPHGNEVPSQALTDETGSARETRAFLDGFQATGLRVEYDAGRRTVTSRLTHEQRPNMTPEVMRGYDALLGGLQRCSWAGDDHFRYYVMAADHPKVFSYGGDFAQLLDAVERRDAQSLRKYGEACIQPIHKMLSGIGERNVSIAAVAGTCLGGGLEGAMAADFVVAERGRKMGLPEANIGMFPGVGGYAMLARKIGRREAERVILGGLYFKTEEAHEMGLVDHLCEPGEIERGVTEMIETIEPRFNTYLTVVRERRRCAPITLEQMRASVADWVDAAMNMEAHHLMLMRHLMSQQKANQKPEANAVVTLEGEAAETRADNPFRAKADA